MRCSDQRKFGVFCVSLFTTLYCIFSHVLIENTNVNCSKEVCMPSNLMFYQPTAVICGINSSACMTYLWKQSNKMEYLGKKDMQYVFTAVHARSIIAKGLSAFPLSNPIFMGYSLVVNIRCRL